MTNHVHPSGGCSCGIFSFETRKPPTTRFICHCLFCQAFTGQTYSDVCALPSQRIDIKGKGALSFKKYRLPPNLNRGRCKSCGQPAMETMGRWPMQMVYIPSVNFAKPDLLPPVKMHIFYNRRVADIADDLPKYENYWPSEFAITKAIMGF